MQVPSLSETIEQDFPRGQPAQLFFCELSLLSDNLFAIATNIPNTKNPPGGRINIKIGSMKLLNIGMEKIVPFPNSSLIILIHKRAAVKPIPIPSPSRTEGSTLFLLANISALPRMIQFTTISGK